MALRAVLDHPKFADLKSRLGCPRHVALGCLEAIWHFTSRFTPQGNIGKYPDVAIEDWLEWKGEPGALIAALVGSGWLDTDEQYRLVVHDWADYADELVHTTLARGLLRFVSGEVPHSRRLNQNERDRFHRWLEESGLPQPVAGRPAEMQTKCSGNADEMQTKCDGFEVSTPKPEPEPEPEPVPASKAKAAAKDKPSQFALPEWIPRQAWNDFEEMRRKIRAPLTNRARKEIVADLQKLEARGQLAEAVLEQSVKLSWRGVFELKNVTEFRARSPATVIPSQPHAQVATRIESYRMWASMSDTFRNANPWIGEIPDATT
jgi:hypothetical protein